MINFTTATNGKTTKTFKNPTSMRSRLKIIKFLSAFALVMLMGVNGVMGQQVIGSFPAQDGGFEGQTAGSLGSSSSTSTWWLSSSLTGTINSTGGRSGPKSANILMSGTNHRTLRGPATQTFAAATAYVIQFYYKGDNNNDGTSDFGDIRGGINGSGFQYGSYTTNANTGSNWVKYTASVTPGAVTSAGHSVVSIVEVSSKTADFDIDDVVIYAGSSADVSAANSPGSVTVNNPTTTSLDLSWGAASGGVDGGGYVVVRYSSSPNADNDPNQNGIYAVGNTHTNGTGSLTGTVRYIGTGTSFTDNAGLAAGTQYWYKVYTVDKAFNYSAESSGNGTTTSSSSSASNIILNSGFTHPTNIDYASYQTASGLTTGNSIEVGQFTIQDGGGSSDADALSTTLTACSITVANSANIRALALFDGSTNVREITTVGSTAAFSSLTIAAADNGSKTFSVRATFKSAVTDNQQISFTVASATASGSGSSFAAANAGAAATTTTGDNNRIEVSTTDIIFDQNPTTVPQNAVMSPSPTIRAVDGNANFDLDNTSNVVMTISTGSTTFGSATTTVAMVAGVATFSNLVFTTAASTNQLTATQGAFTDISSNFNVTAAAPEINLKQNATNLASGSGSHAAGNQTSGTSGSAITFTIENLGSANLTYSSITSSNTTDFTLDLTSTSTPIAVSGTTSFTVAFNPTTAGAKSTTITINNNDADEGTYTFTVTGTGIVSPTVTTPTSASIVNTTATLGGNVTSDGGAAITARGVVWSVDATNNNPTIGGGGVTNIVGTGTTGVFTVNATGLPPNTLIAYRAYATNSVGTTYTTATTFTTLSVATKLVFGTAPAGTGNVGVNLTTFTVQAQRADNSVDAEYVANVTLARNIVSGSATLTGTTTVAAVAGTATFSAAQFNAVGTYTITASSAALTTATSGSIVVSLVNATPIVYSNTAAAGTFRSVSNWTGGSSPGSPSTTTNTDLAQFPDVPTGAGTVGVNMGTGTNGFSGNIYLGALEVTSARTTSDLTIGNNSSSNGLVNLNGANINNVANVILRNSSSKNLFLQNNISGSNNLGLVLGNATNNIINIDGTGGVTISSVISGSGPLTKAGSGSGVLTLSTGNTYTGKTFLTAGTVSVSGESAFGANPASFVADQITFNGGTLSASGNLNFSSNRGLTFTGSSNIINSNGNTVTFTNVATGAGGYTKTGTGILELAGAHTYSGTTTLSAGTLQLAGGNVGSVGAITSSPIGTSTLILNGGTLSSNNTTARTVLNATSIGGDITLGDATNTGALTFDAATTISGATRTLTTASAITFAGAIGDGGNAYGITKAGTGTLSLTAANTYTGLTTISSGGILQLNRTGGTTIPITNNVTISGGTLKISTDQTLNNVTLTSGTLMVDAGVTLTINGSFTGGGTIENNGTIVLVGPSSFPGSGTTISAMNNLTIDRASNVTLDQSITITGNLTLTNGKLITGACDAATSNIALTMADNATITGASASRFVDGILKKTGNDAFTFPIGSGAKYAPVSLTAPFVITDRFAACYAGSNPNSSYSITSKAGSLNNVSKMEYWHINREVGTSSANVTLSWDTIARSGPVRDMTLLRVCHWNSSSSQWTDLGQTGTTGSNASGTITSGSVTSFSPFTLGSSGSANPLPVTWAYFTAQKTDGGNQLDWGTASEKNTSHFEIEYSVDGSQFIAMNNKINAAGNSAHLLEYRCIHKLSPPLIYYRIKQIDLDGLYDYSKTIILKNKDVTSKNFIKVLPSYVQGQEPLTIQGYESNMPFVFYEIINGQGQRILSDKISTIDGYFHHSLSLEMYPTGLYYLRVFNSDLDNIYQGKIRK